MFSSCFRKGTSLTPFTHYYIQWLPPNSLPPETLIGIIGPSKMPPMPLFHSFPLACSHCCSWYRTIHNHQQWNFNDEWVICNYSPAGRRTHWRPLEVYLIMVAIGSYIFPSSKSLGAIYEMGVFSTRKLPVYEKASFLSPHVLDFQCSPTVFIESGMWTQHKVM